MHPRTEATLAELKQAEWFRWVGVHDCEMVEILASWAAAIESCSSLEWENLCLEAANQYRERLLERSPEPFAQWNDIVRLVKPEAQALVREKTEDVIRAHNLPDVFQARVNWDMIHLCMEAEYADIFPPGFYACQAYYYLRGHFPCGYQGEFPRGRLVVY
jgi:hypothetical protein